MIEETRIVAVPHPFTVERIDKFVEPKGSVADILDNSGILFAPASNLRVFVNDLLIPIDQYETYLPMHGDVIYVRAIPCGGDGGKDILRTVMTIAVIAISFYYGGPLVGDWVAAQMFATGASTLSSYLMVSSAVAMATGALMTYGGMQLINAIAPIPQPSMDTPSRDSDKLKQYSIEGTQNSANQWGAVPVILGKTRFIPPLAARSYTKLQGDDQLLYMLYVMGYGNIRIEDMKIGETPIADTNVVYHPVYNFNPATDKLMWFTEDIHEQPLSQLIQESHGAYTQVTTDTQVERISIDIAAPQGLVGFSDDGSKNAKTVELEVTYRTLGVGDWSIGRGGKTFSVARDVFIPGVSPYKGLLGEDLETSTGYSYTIVYMHEATGELFASVPTSWRGSSLSPAQARADAHRHPYGSGWVPICSVARDSDHSTIAPSAITDLRTANVPERSPSGAFLATAKTPNSSFISIAAGTLYYRPKLTGRSASTIRKTFEYSLPTPGQYEVRVTRVTPDTNDERIMDKVYWTALRSFTPQNPINMSGLTLIEMYAKAEEKLSGTMQNFNCVATSVIPDWDHDTSTWIARPTNNPASLIRYILQGAPNKRPLADARINLVELATFHESCEDLDFGFNAAVDSRTSVKDICQLVCAAGRASLSYRDGKYTVIQDIPQTTPVQHFTPRNSWGFTATKVFITLPHAFRVTFPNQDENYRAEDMFVLDDAYTLTGESGKTTATQFEELQLPGITNSDNAWKLGRFHLAQLRLRPETYIINADVENLVCTRGDLVRVVHDVPLWGNGYGRIKTISTPISGYVHSVTIDDFVTMETAHSYAVRFRCASDGLSHVYPVTLAVGEQTTLNFASPYVPNGILTIGDLFLFGELGDESIECLVKSIKPSSDLTAQLELVDYSPAIYTADTGDIPPFNTHISNPPPINLPIINDIRSDFTVAILQADGSYRIRMLIPVRAPDNYDLQNLEYIEVQYRVHDDEIWTNTTRVDGKVIEVSVFDVEPGETYEIRARYIYRSGEVGPWTATTTEVIVGIADYPSNVTFYDAGCTFSPTRIVFVINPISDPDFDFYEIRINENFGQNTGLICQTKSTTYVYANPISLNLTYYLRARDRSGNYSATSDTIAYPTDTLTMGTVTCDFTTKDLIVRWEAIDETKLDHYTVALYTDSGRTQLRATHNVQSSPYIYTYTENAASTAARTIYVRVTVTDTFGRTAYADATGTNATPSTPTGLSVVPIMSGLEVHWTAVTDTDVEAYDVHWGTSTNPTTGAEVHNNHYTIEGLTLVVHHVRVRAKDIFGVGSYSTEIDDTPDSLSMGDIPVDIPMLSGFTWTKTTGPSTIHWTIGTVSYKGTNHAITAGSTTDKYIFWQSGTTPTIFQHAASMPTFDLNTWMMAMFESDTIYLAQQGKIFHGGLIQAGTVLAQQIGAQAVTAEKLKIGQWQAPTTSTTQLLLHFDNSRTSSDSTNPSEENGTSYDSSGKFNSGLAISTGDYLTYTKTPAQTGTFACWVKFEENVSAMSVYHNIFDIQTPRIRLYIDPGTDVLRYYIKDVDVIAQSVTSWLAGEWHFIAITWDFRDPYAWHLFIDGDDYSNTTTKTWVTPSTTVHIGSAYNHSLPARATFDEVRLDSIIYAPDDLSAWYYSGSPYADPGAISNPDGTVIIDHHGIRIYDADINISGSGGGSLTFDQSAGLLTIHGEGEIIPYEFDDFTLIHRNYNYNSDYRSMQFQQVITYGGFIYAAGKLYTSSTYTCIVIAKINPATLEIVSICSFLPQSSPINYRDYWNVDNLVTDGTYLYVVIDNGTDGATWDSITYNFAYAILKVTMGTPMTLNHEHIFGCTNSHQWINTISKVHIFGSYLYIVGYHEWYDVTYSPNWGTGTIIVHNLSDLTLYHGHMWDRTFRSVCGAGTIMHICGNNNAVSGGAVTYSTALISSFSNPPTLPGDITCATYRTSSEATGDKNIFYDAFLDDGSNLVCIGIVYHPLTWPNKCGLMFSGVATVIESSMSRTDLILCGGVTLSGSRQLLNGYCTSEGKSLTLSVPVVILLDNAAGHAKLITGYGSINAIRATYDTAYVYLAGYGYPTFDKYVIGITRAEIYRLSRNLYPGYHATIPRGKALSDGIFDTSKWVYTAGSLTAVLKGDFAATLLTGNFVDAALNYATSDIHWIK